MPDIVVSENPIYVVVAGGTGADGDDGADGAYDGSESNHVLFSLTPTGTVVQGKLQYNPDEDTLDFGMADGVIGQINKETFYPTSVNQTGEHIGEGILVQFAGTLGSSGKILIAPRVADGSVPVEYTMGIVTSTGGIANGGGGHVTWFGKVRGTNTSGTYLTLQDSIDEVNFQTWSDGGILYPNKEWDGHFTNVKPAGAVDKSPIAAVVHAHATNGVLLVRPHLIPRLVDLGDVNGTPLTTTGQLCMWNQAEGHFDFTNNIHDYRLVADPLDVDITYPVSMYDAEPARGSVTNWHGGILSLASGQPLDSSPTDIVVTKGIGKMLIVVNTGSDLVGEITVTGTSVDRDTGVTTPADTDTITVDSLTTDSTTTDANGNSVYGFAGAYVTSKWFQGTVTLSTADLTLTDVDVYHLSFEQCNDSTNLTLNTIDCNLFTVNVNAEFDAYLFTIHVTGDKCDIHNEAGLHVGAVGLPAIADKYERLRRGGIDDPINGLTDGWWMDIHYSNSPSHIEDVTITVWITKAQVAT